MATDIRDLDPNDPEFDAKLEAAVREEDEAAGRALEEQAGEDEQQQTTEGETGQEPGAEGEAAAGEKTEGDGQAAEGAAEPGREPEPKTAPSGVVGKDGATVLPYVVLKRARDEAASERKARQAAEAEAQELREKLAALEAAGGTTKDMRERAEEGLLTDEERADFPALAKIEAAIKKVAERQPKAEKPEPTTPAGETPAEATTADDVQDAIDSIPVLAGWQASDPLKWKRAVAHDEALRESPKWAGKPLAERFARVAQLVAEEFDEDPPVKKPQDTKPAQPRQDPAKVIASVKRAAPNTLSDFKGGGDADPSGDSLTRLPAPRQVERFMAMSDAEIEAQLARER